MTGDTKAERTQAQRLIGLVSSDGELFANHQHDAYVTIVHRGSRQTYPVRSNDFRRWVAGRYFAETGGSPSSQALQDALNVLEGQALYGEGPILDVHTRVGEHAGNIYIDLGCELWRAVEIRADGWDVIDDPPVKFKRPKGMGELPMPARGGSLTELAPFVNLATPEDWVLLVAYAIQALRPRGPYPLLVLHGEQGSAKSTTAKVIRALIDPNAVPLRSEPRSDRDLMIGANNNHLLAFDNISHLPPWLSDFLCRLSTGGGFATRSLYSDNAEALFSATKPVMLNGIEEIVNRSDLIDRTLLLSLPRITDRQRQDEESFYKEFEDAQPRILGAMYDAISSALRNLGSVELNELPRLADFAKWLTAAEPGLQWPAGTFMRAYVGNRETAHELALEASPIGQPLLDLIRGRDQIPGTDFDGTASELLSQLKDLVTEDMLKSKSWPKSANSLASAIKRLAPNLRESGIDVEFDRSGKRRVIGLRRKAASNTVTNVTHAMPSDGGDANDDVLQTQSVMEDAA